MNEPFSLMIGKDVKDMLANDLTLEREGLPPLQQAIATCQEQGDTGTRELLEHLLVSMEGHIQWLEAQMYLIAAAGYENYCAQQIQPE